MAQGANDSLEGENRRVELLDELRHEERKAAVSRVASTLSHALGTPLNVIAGRAAMINMDGMSVDDMRNNARIIEQQVRAVASTLRQVLGFARQGRADLENCDARRLCERAVEVLEPVARGRGIRLETSPGAALETRLQSQSALQTLTNLISLGVRLEPQGGAVLVSLALEHAEPPPRERGRVAAGNFARFVVTYSSTELPESLFEAVYEPWLAAETSDRDSALILALSYGIARENRGWVDAAVGSGKTELSMYWPAHTPV
ncbi:MAG TPA: HAMP domain-containing sensor histidine kinase [Polyangiaceae bacterium]|nr:HAMP domain-containing sensor histidine kinase [Polyangiaceae bacterium]